MKETTKFIIINLINNIYNSHQDFYLNENIRQKYLQDLKIIQKYFKMNEQITVLFCVMIFKQLIGELISVHKITDDMGLKPLEKIIIQNEIKLLKKKGWINTIYRRRDSKVDEYLILDFVIDSVTKNDKRILTQRKPKDIHEALIEIGDYLFAIIDEFKNNELTEVVMDYFNKYQNFELINDILKNKKLIDEEKIMLVYLCTEHINNQKEVNFDEKLIFFYSVKSEIYLKIKRRIINNKSSLFNDGFIEYTHSGFADISSVKLAKKVIDMIGHEDLFIVKQSFKANYSKLIEPIKINPQELFFNNKCNEQLLNLEKNLSNDNYENLVKNLDKKGITTGLTVLFYGVPGTGKTEFVKQLSRKTNRPLLMVDISSIRSMWVGESEKNIKKVFEEYYASAKYFETTPILLFNEADAIIGKRTNVNSSTDQMMNTIQNILLQELEDFKGIFIATTNLENNFDEAFERRILYKLKFDLPDKETTFKILQNEFSEINKELLFKISNNYFLSGGQIYNIKKKLTINTIFDVNDGISSLEDNLLDLIESEMSYSKKQNKLIGYKLIA